MMRKASQSGSWVGEFELNVIIGWEGGGVKTIKDCFPCACENNSSTSETDPSG